MKKRHCIVVMVVLVCGYLVGPYLAGACGTGDRLGPVIYPEAFHQTLYIIAHEGSRNEKPRIPLDSWMYNRPIFYGLPRRLKSSEERTAYIERARQSPSPRLERLIKMNQEVESGRKASRM